MTGTVLLLLVPFPAGGLQQGQQMGPAYYPYIYPGSAAFMYPMAGFQAPSVSSSATLSALLWAL